MSKVTSNKPRQTQTERRAATRQALLEATVQSLIEVGYAATTTRGVAERAGVSQGALQHHFASKALLVNAAISHIVQVIAHNDTQTLSFAGSERERAEGVIDSLWSAHNQPIAHAVYELFYIARTDKEMAEKIGQTLVQGVQLVHNLIKSILPSLATHADFEAWLYRAEAMMRGTVMLAEIPSVTTGYAQWSDIRKEIMHGLDRMLIN